MRNIIVSTDVFAALWASRQPGEDSENAILERLLALPKGPPMPQIIATPARSPGRPPASNADASGGIHNTTFNVNFPQGFEIFRTYKGHTYTAVVRAGRWVMNGISYPSLFALSMEVSESNENPWAHWKYRDAGGRVDFIRALRGDTAPTEGGVTSPKPVKKPARTTKRR
jgi:hypothetical protein